LDMILSSFEIHGLEKLLIISAPTFPLKVFVVE